MPVFLFPLLGTIAGFGVGYFSGSTVKNTVLTVAAVGAGYLAYQQFKGK